MTIGSAGNVAAGRDFALQFKALRKAIPVPHRPKSGSWGVGRRQQAHRSKAAHKGHTPATLCLSRAEGHNLPLPPCTREREQGGGQACTPHPGPVAASPLSLSLAPPSLHQSWGVSLCVFASSDPVAMANPSAGTGTWDLRFRDAQAESSLLPGVMKGMRRGWVADARPLSPPGRTRPCGGAAP